MKNFVYILLTVAAGLLIFNITQLDFSNIFEGDSLIAAIGVLASACVLLLLVILQTSLKIKATKKR
jgi:UDP-N-acetylmuramyl pentapeptide phosphotransferase/UDP-N-acetylglucosamine-1-phosphate transferase